MHLADIAPSILVGLGLADPYGRNAFAPSPSGRECLFLVDGLGADAIRDFAAVIPNICAMKQFASATTSFPSTTATSLPTLMTGELPGVHGMLGYTVRVPRSGGRILNTLKWDERVDPQIWQPVPTLFERAAAAQIDVSHVAAHRYENSGFTRAVFRGATYRGANVLADLIAQTKIAVKNSPSFTYVYANELDVAGHSDGVGSATWLGALAYIDQMVGALMSQLPSGVRIWLTADHGMINISEKIVLGEDNPLLEGIEVIAGEPRARHLYLDQLHLSSPDAAASKMQQFLGEQAKVFTKQEAIAAELFGKEVSLDSQERMGDLILVAHDGVVLIDPSRVALESAMMGHHGGLSDIEMHVPLAMHVC